MAKKKDAEAAGGDDAKGGGKGGKLKMIAIALPSVLLVLGAVYFFVLAPKSSSAAPAAAASATPSPTYVAGKIVNVEPVTINLAHGHFLKVGLGLQATADAGEEVSPSPALDALINEFSGKTVDELATPAGREAARKELTEKITELYEKKIYKIFYTSFVMQ